MERSRYVEFVIVKIAKRDSIVVILVRLKVDSIKLSFTLFIFVGLFSLAISRSVQLGFVLFSNEVPFWNPMVTSGQFTAPQLKLFQQMMASSKPAEMTADKPSLHVSFEGLTNPGDDAPQDDAPRTADVVDDNRLRFLKQILFFIYISFAVDFGFEATHSGSFKISNLFLLPVTLESNQS